MNIQDSMLKKIILCTKKYHPIDDNAVKKIEGSYKLLFDCAEHSEISKEGDSCEEDSYYIINHSLAVAWYIASWRFDYPVVIAALLHELAVKKIIQLDTLSSTIEETAYAVLKEYTEMHVRISSIDQEHLIDDEDVNNNFINSLYPESFYIMIADHVDTMSRSLKNCNKKNLEFAQKTREILIPQVKAIHAYKMVDILEELCFQIENQLVYEKISIIIRKIDRLNEFYRQQFIKSLTRIFDKNSNITPENLKKFQPHIKLFCTNKRSVASIYRFITHNNPTLHSHPTLQYDLEKLNNFYRTAYYDLVLVLSDDIAKANCTTVDVFMQYFETMLQSEGAFLYGCFFTSNKDSYYFLLSDPMKNMYRFFVQSESDYLHYLYGDIISHDKLDLNYVPPKSEAEIKVFRKDGSAEMVEKGTTVLDYAFKIHEDLGLHFGHAILNKNGRPIPAHTVISNGDTVEIKKSETITADLNWFRYLRTDLAINYLIKYFKTQYKRTKSTIKVLIRDGDIIQIQEGATILDLAFMLRKEMGLYFDYAIVNDSKQHFSVDYVLRDGDTIVIQQAPTVQADYHWFKHVKTVNAIDQLVSYFDAVNTN